MLWEVQGMDYMQQGLPMCFAAGGDATENFVGKPHSEGAHKILEKLQVGVVDKGKVRPTSAVVQR